MAKILDILSEEPLPDVKSVEHLICIVPEDYAYTEALAQLSVISHPSQAAHSGRYLIRAANDLHRGILLGMLVSQHPNCELVSQRKGQLGVHLPGRCSDQPEKQPPEELPRSWGQASKVKRKQTPQELVYWEALAKATASLFLNQRSRSKDQAKAKNQLSNLVSGIVTSSQLNQTVSVETVTGDLYSDMLQNGLIEECGTQLLWKDDRIQDCFVRKVSSFVSVFERNSESTTMRTVLAEVGQYLARVECIRTITLYSHILETVGQHFHLINDNQYKALALRVLQLCAEVYNLQCTEYARETVLANPLQHPKIELRKVS